MQKQHLKVRISDLKPFHHNPKKHNISLITKSIKELGFVDDLVIDENNTILSGHGRVEALNKLGETKVDAIQITGWTEDQKKKYLLTANQSVILGGFDNDELKLFDKEELEFAGFDMDLFITPDEKDDQVPEVPKIAKSKLGDLYELGNHRVLCGDSTKKEDVERLMGGRKADMVFTDPPYNIGYDYWDYLDNKEAGEYKEWCESWFRQLTKLASVILLTIGQWNMKMWFDIEKPLGIISWIAKNKTSGSKIAYFSIWEPILVYAKKIKDRKSVDFIANEVVRSDLSLISDVEQAKQFIKENSDIIEVNNKRQQGVGSHKCPKQVSMLTELFARYSKNNDLLLDIFLGSGSTLIACEKTNRVCYGMEIDPQYIDVIVSRYCQFTGNNKIKLNGKTIEWKT